MVNLGVILLAFLSFGYEAKALPTYTAFMPDSIRKGEAYTVDLELYGDDPDPIDFEVQLMSNGDGRYSEVQLSAEVRTAHLEFDPYPHDHEDDGVVEITVSGRDIRTGGIIFSNTSTVPHVTKANSIFIETDKPIYTPGQTIKFRAVVTTPELLPYQGNVSYHLLDPMGNILMKESNAQLTHGVVGNEFKLGRYSALGYWRIKYEVNGVEKSEYVSVKEYKLPKWKIDISKDQSMLLLGSERISGQITARYTFGKPIRGQAVIEISKVKIIRWDVPGTYGPGPKVTTFFPAFNGTAAFDVDFETIKTVLGVTEHATILITAKVTDKNTGESYQAHDTVPVKSLNVIIGDLNAPRSVKPGLPYVHHMRISQVDGSLFNEDELRELGIVVEIEYNFPIDRELSYEENLARRIRRNVEVKPGPDGRITLRAIMETGVFEYVYFRVLVHSSSVVHSWYIGESRSPSNTFMQVAADDQKVSHGDIAKLTIFTTEMAESYRVLCTSQGKVVSSEIYRPASHDTHETYSAFNYSFNIEKEHSPRVQVVVLFVKEDGEFVADSVDIDVQFVLDNKLTITAFPNKTDAGMPVSIKVQAEAGSFVGLKGIDRSVLLLKGGNDITQGKISNELHGYARSKVTSYKFSFIEVMQNSGMILLTDARNHSYFETNSCQLGYDMKFCPEISEASHRMEIPRNIIRSYFPESWIWADGNAGADGNVTFNYTVPDTITTWEIRGFSVSDLKGLGATKESTKITVFRNFFISLDLPPRIVRGEILKMKAIIFNYFDQEVPATITLTDNEWYDIIGNGDETTPSGVRAITVPRQDSVTVVFPIKFTKAGLSRITIRAQSALAADQVERRLRVKPEGIPRVISQSSIIDRRDENEPDTVVNFNVDIPSDAVEGSAYVKFTLSGNILGNSMNNLGSLLKMPSGCGEQNMMDFAPDVYISSFLKSTNQLTGEIERKAESHIREGYQNELRYRHPDGSFSAFGESDSSGSTWLTAFVVKVFGAANQLNSDLIEEGKIEDAISFLLDQQNSDGAFNEPGKVISSIAQGGIDSDVTVAAYVLIALTEGGRLDHILDIEKATMKTQRFLESKVLNMRDIYTFSIVGYALSLVESSLAPSVLSILDSMATTEGNLKYWRKHEAGAAKCADGEHYCPFDSPSTSSSIEITAYVLLSYLKQGRIYETMPIVRWLVKQRGAFGGYYSTQDTVLAIQALSRVAEFFNARTHDIDINLSHDGQPEFDASFEVTNENAIVVQMADLPNVAGDVVISGTGQGFADVQVTVGYNLPVKPRSDEPFVIDIHLEKSSELLKLEVCSRINEERQEVVNGTGMYVVTFRIPSGYTIDDKEATELNPQVKLIEVVDEEVTGYFDELLRRERICMELELTKMFEIEDVKPEVVTCYDYYMPEISAMAMLTLSPDDECISCEQDSTKHWDELPELPADTYCATDTFPCPGFVDGLFYDRSSGIAELISAHQARNPCTAPYGVGDSRLFSGLPASYLNGVDQFIQCSSDHFELMLTSSRGWTFSVAVYPTELHKSNYYSIISLSFEDLGRPYVYLAKRSGTNQYWLRILYNGQQLIVHSIRTRHIPVNRWSLITARLEGGKPSVFVNGKKVGRYSRKQRDTGYIWGPVTLRVGMSPYFTPNKGNFKGLIASLDVWTMSLSDTEILAHYNYWETSLNHADPSLDLAKVRHIVPPSIRKCFNKPYTALELKSQAGDLRTDCD